MMCALNVVTRADDAGYNTDMLHEDMTNDHDCFIDAACSEFDIFDGTNGDEPNDFIKEESKLNELERKKKKQFQIMKLAYDGVPVNLWLWGKEFTFDVKEDELLQTFNLYDKYMPEWSKELIIDINLLHFLTCTKNNDGWFLGNLKLLPSI